MSDHDSPQEHAYRTLHIGLTPRPDGVLEVSPDSVDKLEIIEPFPLPPMAFSNTIWLSSLGDTLWRRRGRCVAAWLILNCRARRWMPPLIPHQKCGRDGAAWRFHSADFADLPANCRLAGSFQTRVAAGPDDAACSVPPIDGLHLVHGMNGKDRTMYTFVGVSGVLKCVAPGDVIFDDWQAAIDQHHDRLELL